MRKNDAALHIAKKVEALDLPALRCGQAAFNYAKDKSKDKFIYDFAYVWGQLIQFGYDKGVENFEDVIEISLETLKQWFEEIDFYHPLDKDFIVDTLSVILKYWIDQRACIKLLAWYYKTYD